VPHRDYAGRWQAAHRIDRTIAADHSHSNAVGKVLATSLVHLDRCHVEASLPAGGGETSRACTNLD
jgi:hypothetical protein